MDNKLSHVYWWCLLASLAGCATFSPPERGPDQLVMSDEFRLYGPTAEVPERWWEQFNSPELNSLVNEAISDNFTLRQAWARIEQAVSIAKQNRAALFPQAGYSGEAELRSEHRDAASAKRLETFDQVINAPLKSAVKDNPVNSTKALFDSGGNEQTVNSESYSLGLTASYEADFWGRLRASSRAALLDVEGTREELYTAMQTVAGQVVLTWLDLLSVRETIRLTEKQFDVNRTFLELIELRFSKGRGTALAVYQQRQVLAQTETLLPLLHAQYSVLRHELAILLGKPPQTALDIGDASFPEPGLLPEYGVPADLLARRPDIRAAGLRLQAADWRVSAARADRLPSLRISAGFSFNGDDIDNVFDNWLATLTGSVTGPIFDAGRRRAEVERTRAVVDERLNAYRQVVLIAIADVENVLVRIEQQQSYITALRKQYEAAQKTHEEALNRYQKGLNDYLPVLSALTTAQNLERTLIDARHNLLVYRVQLHLVLGGDWMQGMASDLLQEPSA